MHLYSVRNVHITGSLLHPFCLAIRMHCPLYCAEIGDVDNTTQTLMLCHSKHIGGDDWCKVTLVWVAKPLPRRAFSSACSWLTLSTSVSATISTICVYVMMTGKLICDDAYLINNFDNFG